MLNASKGAQFTSLTAKCTSFFFSFHQSYKPIVEFIDAQFEAYLQEELKIKRALHNYHDTRIHACLYFIAPTGHSLKSLDLVTMKKLDSKVGVFNSYCAALPCVWWKGCGFFRVHLPTLNSVDDSRFIEHLSFCKVYCRLGKTSWSKAENFLPLSSFLGEHHSHYCQI